MTGPAARFAGWMETAALPLWSARGLDPDGHGFAEHLTLDGLPAAIDHTRVRVQARQIYVYAHAARLGHPGALAIARRGLDFLLTHARLPDGAWARRLGRAGGVRDATVDVYDQAFVLLALAHYGRASGDTAAFGLARATADALDRGRHPHGGLYNAWPADPAAARQQNPHMHLLEAALALYEATGEEAHGVLADEMVGLFARHFLDARTGTLGEFFDPRLMRAEDHVEPGHHMEWVWLLSEHARLRGADHAAAMGALYSFAHRHGPDRDGLLRDVLGRDGRLLDGGVRLWPQTEAVRAHLVMGRPDRAAATLEALHRRFLDPAPDGTWHDHFGSDGALRSDRIPASSLYHLFTAYAELRTHMP